MAHVQTQSEWEEKMAGKVLRQIRSELYLELRFFDAALSALDESVNPSLGVLATDGTRLYYSPEWLLRSFQKNPGFLDRAYLHTVLHCVYSHLWIRGGQEAEREEEQEEERVLWDLACDIAVERVIDGLNKNCTRRPLTWLRQQTYETLGREQILSAAGIRRWLRTVPDEKRQELTREFYTDSHRYWPETEYESPEQRQARNRWDQISRQSRMELERRGSEPEEGEELYLKELKAGRSRRSYREFLRRFAVLREELHCDPDEFDMNYYMYGLGLYGNMPLIEPLESRETMKIEEFVIVVDTSDSTSGELVKNFLNETFGILSRTDSFFHKYRIRIIQCDDEVRMDEKITGREELEALMNRFTLVGGGGTDFRPAFSYINGLVRDGELRNLRGVLYFTDGKGTYPVKRPDYETAFLYLTDYDESAVPPWAMRLRLEPEEFGGGERNRRR